MPASLRGRYRGALLGAAVGDALGAPFEGRRQVRAEAVARVARGSAPLRFTDDTAMSIALGESLLGRGGFDGGDLLARFGNAYRSEPWRGYGPGPPRLFELHAQGVPWDAVASRLYGGAGSFGNGGAMRVVPAALFAEPDLEEVCRLAAQTASVTHTHPLGVEGAVVQAVAITAAVGMAAPRSGLPDEIVSRASSREFREALRQVRALLDQDVPAGQAAAVLGNGVGAIESVPTALFCAFHEEAFEAAVTQAIQAGGDTDTVASMAGAVRGAIVGEEGIPGAWLARLERSDRLRLLADALYDRARTGEGQTGRSGPPAGPPQW